MKSYNNFFRNGVDASYIYMILLLTMNSEVNDAADIIFFILNTISSNTLVDTTILSYNILQHQSGAGTKMFLLQ